MAHLPHQRVDWLTKPFVRFLGIESAAGTVLLSCAVVAIILSNSAWARPFADFWEISLGFHVAEWDFSRSIRAWIDDGLMTLFFFLVALELKRELVLGELHQPRMAALSIAGALGGMLVPAALYLTLQTGEAGESGWGTVMATDTAFVIGCLALLGTRIPHSLRVFMLSLAIVDDIGAVLVVAIGYSDRVVWQALVLAAVGVAAIRVMATGGVRTTASYFLVGTVIWAAVDASGIHPTVTGVVLGLMAPARRWVSDVRLYAILNQVIAHPENARESGDTKDRGTLRLAEVAAREALSPVERLEMTLHPWVGFVIMPLFALANAGLPLAEGDFANPVTLSVFIGLTFGKPIGILAFCWGALRTGVAVRPHDLDWGSLVGGGLLAGIGFTMSLFIANLAFGPALIDSAKAGIFLASVVSAVAGMAALRWMSARDHGSPPTGH